MSPNSLIMLLRSSQIIIVFPIFLFLLFTCPVYGADDDGDDDDTPKSCYKYTTDFLKNTLDTLLICIGPNRFKAKNIFEYGTRFYCILKCVFQEYGTLTSEGKFDDIAAAFFFEENFAPAVQESLLPEVQACFGFAEEFDNNDYWCKSYSKFSTCIIKALVAGMIPYSGNCFTSPVISIVFSVFTSIAPDPIRNDIEELRRAMNKKRPLKCFDRNCTTRYKIEKKNGISSIILYDRNKTEISRKLKSPNSKAVNLTTTTVKYNLNSDRYL